MKNMKDFTPQLMYVDHTKIDTTIKAANDRAEKQNQLFRATEDFLERKLTDDELQDLRVRGMKFVDEVLKEGFQFPNADISFNLQSLGMTAGYEALKAKVRPVMLSRRGTPLSIADGIAYLSEEGKEDIVQANTHHTTNQAQNEALNAAKRLVKELNRNRKYIGQFQFHQIAQAFFFLDHGSQEFFIKFTQIKAIREDGRRLPY